MCIQEVAYLKRYLLFKILAGNEKNFVVIQRLFNGFLSFLYCLNF